MEGALSPAVQALFQRYTPKRPYEAPVGRRPIVRRLLAAQGNRCALCGTMMSLERSFSSPKAASVDHVMPRCMGGRADGNRLLAHRRCNAAKAGRHPHPCELLLLEAVNLRLGWKVA